MPTGVYERKVKAEVIKEVKGEQSNKEVFAYTSGRIEGILKSIAFEHGIAPAEFARGFAEYLYITTRR